MFLQAFIFYLYFQCNNAKYHCFLNESNEITYTYLNNLLFDDLNMFVNLCENNDISFIETPKALKICPVRITNYIYFSLYLIDQIYEVKNNKKVKKDFKNLKSTIKYINKTLEQLTSDYHKFSKAISRISNTKIKDNFEKVLQQLLTESENDNDKNSIFVYFIYSIVIINIYDKKKNLIINSILNIMNYKIYKSQKIQKNEKFLKLVIWEKENGFFEYYQIKDNTKFLTFRKLKVVKKRIMNYFS